MNISTLLLDAGESLKWDAMFPLSNDRVLLCRQSSTPLTPKWIKYPAEPQRWTYWILIENKESKDISHDEAIHLQEEDGWLKVGL